MPARFIAAAFALALFSLPLPAALQPQRPNIILILTDDQGYGDSGVHGNEHIRTPNIDRLAREGVELTRFYVEPVCSPTRASLLTGRYHYRTGVIHTSRGGAKMASDEVTIAELLSANGYRTGMFGKWHLGDNYPMRPQDQGFQENLWHKSGGIGQAPDRPNSYFDPWLWRDGKRIQSKGYCTDIFFSAAIDFIARHQNQPFFVYLATNAPHTPLEVSDEYAAPYRQMGLDDRTAHVYGMITNIDENIGRLVKHLERLQLDEKTLVIFMSDNGANLDRYNAGLRARKGSTYEGGIRGLCFLRWPGRWEGGRKTDNISAHVDLLPTVLELTGTEALPNLQLDGVSLVPLLQANTESGPWPERTIVIQTHRGLIPKPYQNAAVISQRYKLVGYPGTFGDEFLNTSTRNPTVELYDIESDPSETTNLAKQYPGVVTELRRKYDSWFHSVRSSRDFKPGTIHLGSKHENPAVLCRYQDSSYHLGLPHGWPVRLTNGGRYRVSIDRGNFAGPGHLVVRWNGKDHRSRLQEHEDTGIFPLTAGEGTLEIWFELDEGGRLTFSDNHTIGDVQIQFLESI